MKQDLFTLILVSRQILIQALLLMKTKRIISPNSITIMYKLTVIGFVDVVFISLMLQMIIGMVTQLRRPF